MTKEEILLKMGDDRNRIEKALARMAPKEPEKRIAIMTCARSAQGCTGITCAWAAREKLYHFEQYEKAPLPLHLCAIFPCNGCDADYSTDAGMRKKLERLILEDVTKLHLSSCMVHHCKNLNQICALLEEYGLEYEMGTH